MVFSLRTRTRTTTTTNVYYLNEKKSKRVVFSLRAPTQPAKPRMNMMPPTIIRTRAGSRGICVKGKAF